jgi:hypothetical protein
MTRDIESDQTAEAGTDRKRTLAVIPLLQILVGKLQGMIHRLSGDGVEKDAENFRSPSYNPDAYIDFGEAADVPLVYLSRISRQARNTSSSVKTEG